MNRAEAKDVIYEHVLLTWRELVQELNLIDAQERYKDVFQDEPSNHLYWIRISTQVVHEGQESLRNGSFVRRFMTQGLVFVQIFCPRSDDNAVMYLDIISERLRNAFRQICVNENLEFTQAAVDDSMSAGKIWLNNVVSSTFTYRQFL